MKFIYLQFWFVFSIPEDVVNKAIYISHVKY